MAFPKPHYSSNAKKELKLLPASFSGQVNWVMDFKLDRQHSRIEEFECIEIGGGGSDIDCGNIFQRTMREDLQVTRVEINLLGKGSIVPYSFGID
jgi:hypothetical protein